MLSLASKKVRIAKITSSQIPTTGVEFSHPSILLGKSKQNAIFTKKCAPRNTLMPQCLE